jgi:hypothetical protein
MNILNMFDMKDKISSILSRNSNNILIGGGTNSFAYEIFKIIVGIVLIIVAFVIFGMREYWEKINAKVINVHDNMNQCQVNIAYKIDDIIYYKNIVLPGSYVCNYNDTLEIYYNTSNPNIVLLDTTNYFVLAISLIILGAMTLYTVNDF